MNSCTLCHLEGLVMGATHTGCTLCIAPLSTLYIYYILESNLSSDQQWPEAVLIVLKFYFSAKTMGDVKRKCWKYTMYFYYSLMIRNRKTFHSKGCCKDMVCILRLLKCSWLWGKFQLWVKWYMYTCKCRYVIQNICIYIITCYWFLKLLEWKLSI